MKKLISLIFVVSLVCFSNNIKAQSYLIIISSTPSKTVAKNDVDKLQSSGFVNAGMMYHSISKRYRVYLNSFDSKELAQDEADKYKDKYSDSWIYKKQDSIEDGYASSVTKETFDSLKKELSINSAKFDSIQKDIILIKDEIKFINNYLNENEVSNLGSNKLLEDKIKSLSDYVENIEKMSLDKDKEIKELSKYLDEIRSDYVTSSDTVKISRELVKFDFGYPRFYFALGLTQSNLFSSIDTEIQSYFNLTSSDIAKYFYSLNLIGGLNISRRWSTELSLKTYVSNSNFYLFPSIDFKFSQQLGRLPIKINPSVALGTEMLIFKNSSVKGARYILLSPGAELEYGINKRITIFGKGKFNIITQYKEQKFISNKGKCFDLTYGIRFNFLR